MPRRLPPRSRKTARTASTARSSTLQGVATPTAAPPKFALQVLDTAETANLTAYARLAARVLARRATVTETPRTVVSAAPCRPMSRPAAKMRARSAARMMAAAA